MANHSFNCDFTDLSREEIIEEYQKLSAKFAAVKTSEEVALQKNHEYRRNLQLALNREEHLTHELEAVNEQKGSVSLESSEKLRAELKVFRRRMEQAKERAEIAEADAEQLRQEVARLVVEQSAKQPAASSVVNESILSDNQREHLDNLEAMNAELLQSHEMHQTELVEVMQQLSEMKRSEENLMDRLQCAEENLQAKRDELEEKSVLIDSLEEKVAILTAELGSLQSEAANPNKKGNSLFGEVDDQRQVMKSLLSKQKLQYENMKREHVASTSQIRLLKRENAAMRDEVEICSQKFRAADKLHKSTLMDRIGNLSRENEKLQNDYKQLEKRLRTVADKNDNGWINATLDMAKLDTDKLKSELISSRMKRFEAEEKAAQALEMEAKWRFEALKTRCIVIERENQLEENSIAFKPIEKSQATRLTNAKFPDVTKEEPQVNCGSPLVKPLGAHIARMVTTPQHENTVSTKIPLSTMSEYADLSIELGPSDVFDGTLPNPEDSINLMSGESFMMVSVAEHTPTVQNVSSNDVVVVDKTLSPPLISEERKSAIDKTPTAPIVATDASTDAAVIALDDTISPLTTNEQIPTPSTITREVLRGLQQANAASMPEISVISMDETIAAPKYRSIKINPNRLDFLMDNGPQSMKENQNTTLKMPPPSAPDATAPSIIKYAPKVRPIMIKHCKMLPPKK